MAFEKLFNQPRAETELLDLVVKALQEEYAVHENTCYFLKLGKFGEKSEILWQKLFHSLKSMSDFYFDTDYQRACIVIKFESDHYEVLCFGFSLVQDVKVFREKIEKAPKIEVSGDTEHTPMLPRELREGFNDIASELSASRDKKAV